MIVTEQDDQEGKDMETIYCSLDAKRLTICGTAEGRRASGGEETVCYAFLPRVSRPATAAGGKVVDLAAYRQARQAGEALPERKAQEERPACPPVRPGRARRRLLMLAADLAASGAVVLLMAVVVLRLFAL